RRPGTEDQAPTSLQSAGSPRRTAVFAVRTGMQDGIECKSNFPCGIFVPLIGTRLYSRKRGDGTFMAAIAAVAQISTAGRVAAWTGESRRLGLDQDLQLIERCLGGEQAAWEDLVKVHTRRVYAICCRFT